MEQYFEKQVEQLSIYKKLGKPKFEILIGLLFCIIYLLIYLSADIFKVDDGNDFGEYFVRAERWARGDWWWKAGSDKLLSFVEMFAIKLYPHNFLDIYRTIQISLISITIFSVFIFIVSKTKAFPGFYSKIILSAFFLAMPYFMFKVVSVDQSILFTALLLLFFGTYNNKFLGVVALLLFISRPEAVILFPFYILFFIIDKENRKNIAINFGSFIILLIAYKYFDGIMNASDYIEFAVVEERYEKLWAFDFKFIGGLVFYTLSAPLRAYFYSFEILQNYLLIAFFTVGIIFAVRKKEYWAFYGIFIFYSLMVIAFNPDWQFPYRETLDATLPTLKFFNTEISFNHVPYGHSRYRVFLYPAMAAFVIFGFVKTINFITYYLRKNKSAKNTGNKKLRKTKVQPIEEIVLKNSFPSNLGILIFIFILCACSMFAISFIKFNDVYSAKEIDKRLNPLYLLSLDLRGIADANDIVMLDDMCDGACGSTVSQVTVFSGVRYFLLRICDNCPGVWMKNHPENKILWKNEEIKEQHPSWIFYYDYFNVNYGKTIENADKLNRLFEYHFDDLNDLNVKYIINTKKTNQDTIFQLIKEIQGVHLYKYIPQKINLPDTIQATNK